MLSYNQNFANCINLLTKYFDGKLPSCDINLEVSLYKKKISTV